MSSIRIVETRRVSSAGRLDKLPEPTLPEVAFAGRSNVGKSSLLAALTGTRKLFPTSKTPGRTRTIVHVEARLANGARFYLVDLPGYGYAKVAKGAKRAWADLLEAYLGKRSTLFLVVLIVDVRRGPEQEEAELLDYLATAGVPAMLVATKLDKLNKAQQKSALQALGQEVGSPVIGISAVKRQGFDRLLASIVNACKLA